MCGCGASGVRIFAHGRDPFFDGWSDTLQLDYSNPQVQDAMRDILVSIADRADGVRCDMAMLVLPDVFDRTWGRRPEEFWPRAIGRVRGKSPEFLFMAEVYWDLEWRLQQQGFDYTYDKRLYDRLREGAVAPVREHLMAGLDFQDKLARFLENHDEPRAAATFGPGAHEAAAIITYLTPGLRFFHHGQFEGRRVRFRRIWCARRMNRRTRRWRPLRSTAVGAAPARIEGRLLSSARVHAGLGRQLDLGRIPRVVMAWPDRRAPARGRQ
jgi:glycosidase